VVRLEDKFILERDAHDEFDNPLPQKICEDRTIYLSRNNHGRPISLTGIVSITDFELSVRGDGPHNGCIQAEPYHAPEVILDAGWTYSSDIWSLGVMACTAASVHTDTLRS
jgi:serine/threonine-protein kinase SRPK3